MLHYESYYNLPHNTIYLNTATHLPENLPHSQNVYHFFFWSIHKFCGVTMLIAVARHYHDDHLHNNCLCITAIINNNIDLINFIKRFREIVVLNSTVHYQCCQHRGLPAQLGYFEIACRGSKNCWAGDLKLGYFSFVCPRQLFFHQMCQFPVNSESF